MNKLNKLVEMLEENIHIEDYDVISDITYIVYYFIEGDGKEEVSTIELDYDEVWKHIKSKCNGVLDTSFQSVEDGQTIESSMRFDIDNYMESQDITEDFKEIIYQKLK